MNSSTLTLRSSGRHREAGIAIILVLAFIVILTALVFAFFSRALTERQVANSSLNQSKADILARSAVDVIVGDFKQEIIDGSASPALTPTPGVVLYLPKTAANMLPRTSGTPFPSPAGTNVIPNMVRRSVQRDPLAQGTTKTVTTSASAVNSTTDVSANGRAITSARWNSHYLIPRDPALYGGSKATTIGTDPIPNNSSQSGFTAPDWVVVSAEEGPVVLSGPNKDSTGNPVTPIGRYAYAIYDEGGLLDVNAVGYPSPSSTPVGTPLPPYKSSLAFADIKVILPSGTPLAKQAVVDDLVGWRNYASAQPGGSFGSYTFDPNSAKRYFDFLLGSNTSFLTVNPQPYPSPVTATSRTDQLFTSRQALLKYRRDTSFSQDALQYLTHFSRDLNQPSVAPDATRPKISNANPNDPATFGGNDGGGGDDIINPSFLSIRTATTFTRNDGSQALVPEPLVKTRFPLNRLGWITYKGPSAIRNIPTSQPATSDPDYDMWQLVNTYGLSKTYLQQGTAANILKSFGLTWAVDNMSNGDGQSKWRYDHGMSSSGGNLTIGTLSKVAALTPGREPDFVELVKAAVSAGSIAKAGSNGSVLGWNYKRDKSVDNAVIQIVANIIDQFDVDGFPTRILFDPQSAPASSSFHQEFYGVENVPYLYRMRAGTIQVHMPVPPPSADATESKVKLYTTSADLSDPGVGVDLIFPEIWNPHDPNSATGNPCPTSFRFVVDGADPESVDPSGAGNGEVKSVLAPSFSDSNQSSVTPGPTSGTNFSSDGADPSSPVSPGASFAQLYTTYHRIFTDETALLFQVPSGRTDLFREPTYLARVNMPNGSALQAGPKHRLLTDPVLKPFVKNGGIQSDYDDPFGLATSNTPAAHAAAEPKGQTGYLGFAVGPFPYRWVAQEPSAPLPVTSPPTPPRKFVLTANGGGGSLRNKSPDGNYTYSMQCADASGAWITYDVKLTDIIANLGHEVESYGSANQVSNIVESLTREPIASDIQVGPRVIRTTFPLQPQ